MDSHILDMARARDINLSGVLNNLLTEFLELGELSVSEIKKIQKEIESKQLELNALKTSLLMLKREEEKEKEKQEKNSHIQRGNESRAERMTREYEDAMYKRKGRPQR